MVQQRFGVEDQACTTEINFLPRRCDFIHEAGQAPHAHRRFKCPFPEQRYRYPRSLPSALPCGRGGPALWARWQPLGPLPCPGLLCPCPAQGYPASAPCPQAPSRAAPPGRPAPCPHWQAAPCRAIPCRAVPCRAPALPCHARAVLVSSSLSVMDAPVYSKCSIPIQFEPRGACLASDS